MTRMARAIFRSSVNGPSPNNIQLQLRKELEAVGFIRIGTGCYEGEFDTDEEALEATMVGIDFLARLPAGFRVDHMWVYLDTPDEP